MSKKDERIPQIVDMMLRPGGATINEMSRPMAPSGLLRSSPRPNQKANRIRMEMAAPIMAAMLEVATVSAGEFLSGWGQDFQSGAPGGLALPNRPVVAGELIPLDIGVGVRGYRCDLCRTFSVDGHPTDEQAAAHARILEVMKLGETLLRPGQSCREMFEIVHRELEGWNGYGFFHHVGHGIGLDAHEVPRINPAWDDTFAVGDVVAFEPGLYGGELRAGIRLENNYLITESGPRQLSHFPLDLI